MSGSMPSEDRPDPRDNPPALRARVTDDVAPGIFSSGVIVMTGPTEFVLDFVQNLTRPHRVAARVILPHTVLAQFLDALRTNLGLYEKRFGPPPQPPGVAISNAGVSQVQIQPGADPPQADPAAGPVSNVKAPEGGAATAPSAASGSTPGEVEQPLSQPTAGGETPAGDGTAQPPPPPPRHSPSPQEVYDDLKLPDELLSGVYANGVMIGHGASEFCLDFLTSFFPQSAVSARIYMAAGQIPRLIDSMQNAVSQLQRRGQRPPGQNRPDAGSDEEGGGGPAA